MLPIPQRYYVPNRIRESYKPRLQSAELWDPPRPEGEQGQETSKFGLKNLGRQEEDPKEKMRQRFAREQVTPFILVITLEGELANDRSWTKPEYA